MPRKAPGNRLEGSQADMSTIAARRILAPRRGMSSRQRIPETTMSKGLDKKKEQKKKPAKTLKEKRAEKSEKKAGKN